MRKLLSLSAAIFLMITLTSGCGPAGSSKESRTEAEKQQALRDSAFGPMVETMDRARGVDQLQHDRKGKLDAAMTNSEE
jgi:hypothetical protein